MGIVGQYIEKKMCGKKQHVQIDNIQKKPKLICGKSAVGEKINSTRYTIYEETDANGDTKRMVEISSWGHKVYVDYDEYVDIVSDDCINQPFSSITITTVN